MTSPKKNCAVVALGGNALAPPDNAVTVAKQFKHTRQSLRGLLELFKRDYLIAIVHGNGPQVGAALRRVELARDVLPDIPLGLLVADTEGSMGYMIEQSLQKLLPNENIRRDVITLITQVLVDINDPALKEPSKFIGRTFSREEATELIEREGWDMKPLSDQNKLRRVVGSPKPVHIINGEVIRRTVHSGAIVIAAGGGGIPVYQHPEYGLEGVDAVIDKDLAAALLAKEIEAEELIILTNIDTVRLNFSKPDEQSISRMNLEEAQEYLDQGQFPPGSMGPKIEAAIKFIKEGGKRTIICELDQVSEALKGEAGTEIVL